MPGSPPFVAILEPSETITLRVGGLLILQGMATDHEDGVLPGASLVWGADRDGALGAGEEVARATLTVGTHHVMFTATDWDGQQAIATVTVSVPGTAGQLYLPLVQH